MRCKNLYTSKTFAFVYTEENIFGNISQYYGNYELLKFKNRPKFMGKKSG